MNLTLNLTPEAEARLRDQAAQRGKSLETIALEAIDEKLSADAKPNDSLSKEEWARRFDSWVASHRLVKHLVDDSRESIYEGRGE